MEKNLKPKGVKFPSGSKLIELICLFNHMPNPISQDEMEKWHTKNGKEYKRQARHLADAGWFKNLEIQDLREVFMKKISKESDVSLTQSKNPIQYGADTIKKE